MHKMCEAMKTTAQILKRTECKVADSDNVIPL